jgi:diacylglycerol O-acyltransferase / wax synthase
MRSGKKGAIGPSRWVRRPRLAPPLTLTLVRTGVMSMERLTADDRLMLWPDELWPQDIGALAVLDGSRLFDPDGRFRIEAVRKAIERRLHLVPRFRQLLHIPPRRLGGPLWVDAPSVDLTDHVAVLPLPAPADESQLLLAIEQLRRRRLDRSRPLWEMWFLIGLPDRRVGLFVRTHHVIADGLAGVATIATFLDGSPDATHVPSPPWKPGPAPTERELRTDKRGRQVRQLRETLSMLAHPVATVQHALSAWPATHELLAERPFPVTSLDRLVGADRTFALVRSSLELIKEIAHESDATVNGVLLTIIAGGLRGLLSSRSEPIEGSMLGIYVPVSLHQGPRAQAQGNLIGQMVVPLPIGVSDPVLRLQLIAMETARRKARSRPSLGRLPRRGIAGRIFLKLLTRRRVNVTSADIPGPEAPVYFARSRVLEVFPLVPLMNRVYGRGRDVVCGTVQHHGGRRRCRLPRSRCLDREHSERAACPRHVRTSQTGRDGAQRQDHGWHALADDVGASRFAMRLSVEITLWTG